MLFAIFELGKSQKNKARMECPAPKSFFFRKAGGGERLVRFARK
jgi:hypothetical protein